MQNFLENAPSTTGGKSGGGRGNNPPGNRVNAFAGWPVETGEPSGGVRDNDPRK